MAGNILPHLNITSTGEVIIYKSTREMMDSQGMHAEQKGNKEITGNHGEILGGYPYMEAKI